MIPEGELVAAVARQERLARTTISFVHDHPELGHEERECSAYLAETLAELGLEVERGAGGMETGFRAVLRGGLPGRTVGIVCLYDAVPAVGADGAIRPTHSCGHGPIAGSVVAAAAALAQRRDELAGALVVVGCPSDEIHAPGTVARGGGKLLSVEAGLWDGVDAALYCHPEFLDTVNLKSRWMRRDRLVVAGTRSLQAGARQEPIEALGRLVQALAGHEADAVLLEHATLDGDVEEGTGLHLEATVLLFGDDGDELETSADALREEVGLGSWESGRVVEGVRPDAEVGAAVEAAFRAAGRSGFVAEPPPLPFATDFGNISRRVPAALIGVGREGGWAFHTDEGAAQFASEDGVAAAMTIATVLALAAARLAGPIL